MEYLARGDAPFSGDLWKSIDNAVVNAAKKTLTGRRFVPITGPMGGGVQIARIDRVGKKEEFEDDGVVVTAGRKIVELPQLYSDFWLYWRDLESIEPTDLSAAILAAQEIAKVEDNMIYYGNTALGIEGILTAKGTVNIKRSDWSTGEGAFTDIAKGVTALEENNRLGRYALVLSSDLYVQLQRIQPGTGVLEVDRIRNLVGEKIIKSTVLKPATAFLVCAESYCMDLFIGQDMATAYLELVDLNHHLRVLETALFRIKAPDAIVVFK